jgi:hypothetical protein
MHYLWHISTVLQLLCPCILHLAAAALQYLALVPAAVLQSGVPLVVPSLHYDSAASYLTSCLLLLPPCCIPPLSRPQVLREIDNATKAFPNAYIRMCAFDASRQVQVASMLVHRPASAKEWRP